MGLHLIAMNVLYPKILGKRLQLNPLAVTIVAAVLGMAVGRDGTDSGGSDHRRRSNHLRPHRAPAALRGLAGRVAPLRLTFRLWPRFPFEHIWPAIARSEANSHWQFDLPLNQLESPDGGFCMAHMVNCVKLGRETEGLDEPPFDSELGQKIYENVSKLAWEQWQEHMKMLLNEYRLQPWKKEHQEFIVQQMEAYFFGEGAEKPKEYVPPSRNSRRQRQPAQTSS